MSTPWVLALWRFAAAISAVAVRLWVEPWRSRISPRARRRLTVLAALLAIEAVTLPSMMDRGWGVLWAEPGTLLARVCLLGTVAMLWWSRVGDPSMGRRRCPSCWYNMSATPGLVCAECGGDARDEANLYRSRPSRRAAALALLPLAAAAGVSLASLARDPVWPSRLPDCALIAISPLARPGTVLGAEVAGRSPGFAAFESAIQRGVSRGVIRWSGDEERILLHVEVLDAFQRVDHRAVARLIALTSSSAASVRERAAELLGTSPSADSVAQAALLQLMLDPNTAVREAAVRALMRLREGQRQGTPPAQLVGLLTSAHSTEAALAAQVLMTFDATNAVREALLASNPSPGASLSFAIAAARLFPDDPRSASRVVAQLRLRDVDARLIDELIAGDAASREEDGSLAARRRMLYTNAPVLEVLRPAVLRPARRTDHGNLRTDWVHWFVAHPELHVRTKIETLQSLSWRPGWERFALEEVAKLGPRAESLRWYVRHSLDDPSVSDAARKALEAMGPDLPSTREPVGPPSTIPR